MENLVYLAGPISGLTYSASTNWRETAKNLIHPSISTLSPLRGKTRLREKTNGGPIADHYNEDPLTSAKGINTRDYNDVKRASALLVNMLGAERVSIGTCMEIAWARAFSIPVVLIMERQGNIHEHCMLEYACGYRVETISDGVSIINNLLLTDKELAYEDTRHVGRRNAKPVKEFHDIGFS